jgi:hypothetical protein
VTLEQYAELAAFLYGLAEGRGGELTEGARATCERWAEIMAADLLEQ